MEVIKVESDSNPVHYRAAMSTKYQCDMVCKDHDYQLKHYCEDCEQLICHYCTEKEHSGHKHDHLKQVAIKHRDELRKKTKVQLEEMYNDLSKATTRIESTLKTIKKKSRDEGEKVDWFYDNAMEKLKKQRMEQKDQLAKAASQKKKALKKQLEEVRLFRAQVESIRELTEDFERDFAEQQEWILSAKKQAIEHVKEMAAKHESLDTTPVESDTLEFIPIEQPFPQFLRLCTEADPHCAKVERLPAYAFVGEPVKFSVVRKGVSTEGDGDKVAVQVKSSGEEASAAEVEDNGDGSFTASFVAKEVGDVKVSVSIADQPIKGSPYTVAVRRSYPAIDKPSKVVTADDKMGAPWGIAFGSNGVWAVADNSKHCIYIFDAHDKLVKAISGKRRSNGLNLLNRPEGLAFDNTNCLYVADYGNHKVKKFNIDGNLLLEFGGKGSGDGELKHPIGVAVHDDGRVYVADRGNKRISVFTKSGFFCLQIGVGECEGPYDVVIDAISTQLLVADYAHHCVHRFELDGRYVGQFAGEEADKGRLNGPLSLATDVHGFTLVANAWNHCVLVFDKDGHCIHCIKSKEVGDDGFGRPFGIALSANGSIYVSDYEHGKVHIFSSH